jgi:hypothetical protein
MKCFNHSTVDAVAVCKSCGRALCRDCIAEVGLSCSCRGRCESIVATENELRERGSTAYQKTSASYLRSGIFIMLLGGLFLLLGVVGLAGREQSGWNYFMLVIGVLFAGMGVSNLISAKRLRQR